MLEEKDYQIASELYNQSGIKDFHIECAKYFNRRVTHISCAVGRDSSDTPHEEFLQQVKLGLSDNISRVYNMITLFTLKTDNSVMFGFKYFPHTFYQDAAGQVYYIEPDINGNLAFRKGTEITLDDAMEIMLDVSISELEHWTKVQIRAFGLVSPSEFMNIYDFVASKVDNKVLMYSCEMDEDFKKSISFCDLSESDGRIVINSVQDNYLANLKTSISDHFKFAVMKFTFAGTEYQLYPVNEYATFCLEYDKQKVYYPEVSMKMFLESVFTKNASKEALDNEHYNRMIPLKAEMDFVPAMQSILDNYSAGPEIIYKYNRYVLTAFGEYLSYTQVMAAGMDSNIIKFCHFELEGGLGEVYLSKVEHGVNITFTSFINDESIVFKSIEQFDSHIDAVLSAFTQEVYAFQDDLINEVEEREFIDTLKGLKLSKHPMVKHMVKAWNNYLKEDETRTAKIKKQLYKLQEKYNVRNLPDGRSPLLGL